MATYIKKSELERVAIVLANNKYKEKLEAIDKELGEKVCKALEDEVGPEIVGKLSVLSPEKAKYLFRLNNTYYLSVQSNSLYVKYRDIASYVEPTLHLPRTTFTSALTTKELFDRSPEIETLTVKRAQLNRDRRHLRSQLQCVLTSRRFTANQLKAEFPEAYKVCCDVIGLKVEEATSSTSCDSIENVRAKLLSGK